MIFISVDLPAPFSPSTAWISPGSTRRRMRSLALTAGYCLLMSMSSRRSIGRAVRRMRDEVSARSSRAPGAGNPRVDQVAIVRQGHPGEQSCMQAACQNVALDGHRADRNVPHADVGNGAGLQAADLAV